MTSTSGLTTTFSSARRLARSIRTLQGADSGLAYAGAMGNEEETRIRSERVVYTGPALSLTLQREHAARELVAALDAFRARRSGINEVRMAEAHEKLKALL
jgi:hypothetical protein